MRTATFVTALTLVTIGLVGAAGNTAAHGVHCNSNDPTIDQPCQDLHDLTGDPPATVDDCDDADEVGAVLNGQPACLAVRSCADGSTSDRQLYVNGNTVGPCVDHDPCPTGELGAEVNGQSACVDPDEVTDLIGHILEAVYVILFGGCTSPDNPMHICH